MAKPFSLGRARVGYSVSIPDGVVRDGKSRGEFAPFKERQYRGDVRHPITISQQILRRAVPGKGRPELPSPPIRYFLAHSTSIFITFPPLSSSSIAPARPSGGRIDVIIRSIGRLP